MKKLLTICLLLVCVFTLTACGQEEKKAAPAEPATAVFNTSMGDLKSSWQQTRRRRLRQTLSSWRRRAFMTALSFTAS